MNAKNFKSPRATAGPADESDDPGPSRAGDAPEPALRITGEAANEIDSNWLRDHVAQATALISVPVRALNIEVVHDGRMIELHEQHLGIGETTDVLTFPASENDEPIEADIVICLDEARWRADQFEHAVERELLLYALHGLLHCAGFDDHEETAFEAMHAEEDRILEAIGVGRTFWAEVVGAAGHDAPGGEEGRPPRRERTTRDRGTQG